MIVRFAQVATLHRQCPARKLLTLNLQRVFTLTQRCLPLLRAAAEQGGKAGDVFLDPARIINVSLPASRARVVRVR